MKARIALLTLALLPACATYNADLRDISTETNKNGVATTRTITTHIKGTALGSAKQTIAQFKALQTDKTQSIGGAGVAQQGGTNVVGALEAIEKIVSHITPP